MKKKIIPAAIIALVLLVIALLLPNFYPLLLMKPTRTGVISNTEILAVKESIGNVYVIQSSEGLILIDAGLNANALKKALEKENISNSSVKHILLTHSDGDHVAAVSQFPNAKVYMSEDELQMVNGEITQGKNNSKSKLKYIGLDTILLLTDEQEITIGEHTIKCIKVPGHTTGSMAYIVDEEYLFTGDSFRVKDNKILIHPFSRDEQLSKSTIDKLLTTIIGDTKYTFTTHYGYFQSADLKMD